MAAFSSHSAANTPIPPIEPILCIGLMSGTSMDGVDGVLLAITPPKTPPPVTPQSAPALSSTNMSSNTALSHWGLQQLAFSTVDMPEQLKQELLALNTATDNELHRAALATNALMRLYAQCVQQLCAQAKVTPEQVAVVGAHGQTVRHCPRQFDGTGYTLQLVNGALLAELCGIAVACDFRSRDVAAGGQGAPLVPVFHQALFMQGGAALEDCAVLNLGGIANISVLQTGQAATGFDCGPANALLDYWCHQHTGQPFDANGAWAAQGQVHADLLAQMMAEPFIAQTPPKSTGRDLYNPQWLHKQLSHSPQFAQLAAVDVQATLTAYTAQAAALHVQRFAPHVSRLVVCGGGVRNDTLMQHFKQYMRQYLPHVQVLPSQELGIDPQTVEASAFAWLALHTLQNRVLHMHSITGAAQPRVLGCLYAA